MVVVVAAAVAVIIIISISYRPGRPVICWLEQTSFTRTQIVAIPHAAITASGIKLNQALSFVILAGETAHTEGAEITNVTWWLLPITQIIVSLSHIPLTTILLRNSRHAILTVEVTKVVNSFSLSILYALLPRPRSPPAEVRCKFKVLYFRFRSWALPCFFLSPSNK